MKNKVCVVTGATSGLGLQTLKTMLDQGCKHVTGTYFNDDNRAEEVKKMLSSKYDDKRFNIIKADARTVEGNQLTFDPSMRSEYLPQELIPINCVNINAGMFGPANINENTFLILKMINTMK